MNEKEKLVFVTNNDDEDGITFHFLKPGTYARVNHFYGISGVVQAEGVHITHPSKTPLKQSLLPRHYMPVNWEL